MFRVVRMNICTYLHSALFIIFDCLKSIHRVWSASVHIDRHGFPTLYIKVNWQINLIIISIKTRVWISVMIYIIVIFTPYSLAQRITFSFDHFKTYQTFTVLTFDSRFTLWLKFTYCSWKKFNHHSKIPFPGAFQLVCQTVSPTPDLYWKSSTTDQGFRTDLRTSPKGIHLMSRELSPA